MQRGHSVGEVVVGVILRTSRQIFFDIGVVQVCMCSTWPRVKEVEELGRDIVKVGIGKEGLEGMRRMDLKNLRAICSETSITKNSNSKKIQCHGFI
jgi:hypothetical protein